MLALQVHSVEITEIYSHTYLSKFRENIIFIKEITEELIWQNNFSVRVNFAFFHTVKFQLHNVEIMGIYSHAFLAKISWK